MIEAQRHLRVHAEGLVHVLRVVLAGQAQQHARLALRQHELLQRAARRIEHDALRAVLAADAAPQRFVAIERDHLVRRGAQGVDLAREHGAERGEKLGRVGHVAQFVGVRIVRLRDRIELLRSRPGSPGTACLRP